MNWLPVLELTGRVGLARAMLRVTRRFPPLWLTVLGYHRVCEDDPASPWDRNLISATPDAFRKQLSFIRRHFSPVTSDQVILWRKGQFEMPRNPIVVTFDDGYRDCHDVALPLLLEAGVTADFFVCPWHIDNGRLFWWDRITYCLKRSAKECVAVTYPRRLELDVTSETAVEASRLTMVRTVKYTRGLDLDRFVDELQHRADVEIDERTETEGLLMGWDHVRALRRAGMGVGSHSYSHPILSLADSETVRQQMVRSKAAIEAQIGERIRVLAYPVGRFSDGTKALATEAGYELAYSYCSGASFLRSADMLEIRRAPVEKEMSLRFFRSMVAMPFCA